METTRSVKKARSLLGAVPLAARRHLTAMVERLPDQGVDPVFLQISRISPLRADDR